MTGPRVDAAGVCHHFEVTVPKGALVDGKKIHTNRRVTLEPFNLSDSHVAWKGTKGPRTVSVRAVQIPSAARQALFLRGSVTA